MRFASLTVLAFAAAACFPASQTESEPCDPGLGVGGQCLDDAECESQDCSCNLGGAERECCSP